MDKDNFWVRREEDTEEDRTYFSVDACPAAEQCSTQSWQRVTRSGFDQEALRSAIKQHLMASSLHQCDDATAECYLAGMDLTIHTETYADREAYRKQCEKAKEVKAQSKAQGKAHGEGGKGKGKDKKGKGKTKKSELDEAEEHAEQSRAKRQKTEEQGGGNWQWQEWKENWPTAEVPGNEDVAVARQLCEQVARLSRAVEAGALGQEAAQASGSQAPPPAVTTVIAQTAELVQVPLRQAQLLYESLTRAQQASAACQRSCERLGMQFQQEAVVLQRAQQGLKMVLLQHGGAACVPGGAEEMQWATGI